MINHNRKRNLEIYPRHTSDGFPKGIGSAWLLLIFALAGLVVVVNVSVWGYRGFRMLVGFG